MQWAKAFLYKQLGRWLNGGCCKDAAQSEIQIPAEYLPPERDLLFLSSGCKDRKVNRNSSR